MLDVRAVVELGEHAQQSDAADRPPADKFDQAVGGISLRGNEHRAAGEFAVAEGKKKAAAFVPFLVIVAPKAKSAAPQLNDAYEDSKQITKITERFEIAIRQRTYIGSETQAKKVERIDFSRGVRQPNQIDWALSV